MSVGADTAASRIPASTSSSDILTIRSIAASIASKPAGVSASIAARAPKGSVLPVTRGART
jgi:hypothetical protein